MTDSPNFDLSQLRLQLQQAADEEKRVQMEKYMRSLFPFMGVQKPIRQELTKDWIRQQAKSDSLSLRKTVIILWEQPEREFQYIAMDLMQQSKSYQAADCPEWLMGYIRDKSWWDTVDFLASHLLGKHLLLFPQLKGDLLRSWGQHEDKWVCRSAIIAQLGHKQHTDLDLLSELIELHRGSGDFFIQKAIGWALREVAKRQPVWVQDFCDRHLLKPLSRREALKNIKN
jgi:3-methyladenine DNA glycosylase AlkD